MGTLMDLIEALIDIGEVYRKYGVKGCVLLALGLVAFFAVLFGIILVLAR